MAGRPKGTYTLSQWEIDEMLWYRERGWKTIELAWHYGITTRTVNRIVNRERKKERNATEGTA